jgi:adenylate cyclase
MSHAPLTAELESWLLDESLFDPDIVELFGRLCVRLGAIGIPLDRAALSWPTLHPLFQAEQIYWRRDSGAELIQYRHELEISENFRASPFNHVLSHGLARLRRRLEGPEALIDFPVLEELVEQGFTDYLMTATSFRIADVDSYRGGRAGVMASWSTRRPGGFADADLEALDRVQKVFAVACHVSIQKRVMSNLAGVYLGPTAARRVLSGTIRRADGERINAVVYLSDLRGSTRMSSAMPADDYLELLRCYYDCAAQPVLDEGGEILEFIGDAVLAIFPVDDGHEEAEAVRRATRAMESALANRQAQVDALPPDHPDRDRIGFGIAITRGEVTFGNIGVPQRLTFSAIGPAVNAVARLDELTKQLGRAVLVTEAIASVEPERWVPLGPHRLRDFDTPVEIYARACTGDSFRPVEAAAG